MVKKGGKQNENEDKPSSFEINCIVESYSIQHGEMPITVTIYDAKNEYVPIYDISIPYIGEHTQLILEEIRKKLIQSVHFGLSDIQDIKKQFDQIKSSFESTIRRLIDQYFPSTSIDEKSFMTTYLILKSIGLGEVEILMSDPNLEEIAINGSKTPVWVYHMKRGWLKTNVVLKDEKQIRYYATSIGRKVGRQITTLDPLLDATINVGDRVNATLMPISNEGNTITIRKFSSKPWTITDFLIHHTISVEATALLWQAIQFEMSILIAGGTASGKTSMLNILSNFFSPSNRIISIEDTREIKLPSFLHWIPMMTRLPNPEGRGGVSMLDLLQNSLRQRPDKILVGEVRRAPEAEVLFEAMHTGHSVYATVHANTSEEAVARLTNPPINIPKILLSALSLVVVQYRNRRNGVRRTFQIAEILKNGDSNVLYQHNPNTDKLEKKNASKNFTQTLSLFSGISSSGLQSDLKEKEKVLNYLVKNNINTVEEVGHIMAEYYTAPKELMVKIFKKK